MFGAYKCNRLTYAVILVAFFAFDFAKTSIERFLAHLYNQAMNVAVPDTKGMTPEAFAAAGGIVTKQNEQIIFLDGNLMKFSPGAKTDHLHITNGNKSTFETIMPTEEFLKKVKARSTMREVVNSAHLTALWAIGIAGLVFMAWAIFARIRDIGWNHYVGLGILGTFIIKQLALSQFPPMVLYSLHYTFLFCLIGLVCIPSDFPSRNPPALTSDRPPTRLSPGAPRPLFSQGRQRSRR